MRHDWKATSRESVVVELDGYHTAPSKDPKELW